MTLISLRTSASRAVAAIDARTPAHRDRAVDGLRALALLAVPIGHWLLGGFTLDPQGALHNASPLSAFGFFAPLSWVLQMLGIFFLVGGYASALSFRRARERGTSRAEWLRGRLARLGRPVLGVTAVWAALIPVLHGLGVPWQTLRTGSTLVIQPLWFVGVYAVITALTPWCVRAARRFGAWSAAPLLGSVALVDFLRYGPAASAMPSWLSLLNLLPGWMFAYQLGVSWGEKRLGRRGAWFLLTGGTVLFALLLLAFHYPASMVGVPGEARTNSHPPSLLVLALGAAQCGAAILLRDRIGGLLRRPALWAPVVVINLSAMTILCWHQTAMLTAAVPAASFAGAVPGLTTPPDTLAWIAVRLAWLPLFAVVLALTGRYARGFESPWKRARGGRRALAGLLAAGFTVFALGLA
ncbi:MULTISPECIES: acyltransferase [unclassified Streptomyces]|uniref:acyltransferase family protein n=1 Tax=unclassified Streptomyces TaxID=2593676 RepID=UPI000DBA5AA0|nr:MULTISPECIES: acyltransferase [unclassified Streptomyces]MYT70934.1 acyltransferase family protein [Streptomyces sp. SID8367]RAJ90642.1 acyltransferase-like protein [Streptomyces sp. PsTaAH-137]